MTPLIGGETHRNATRDLKNEFKKVIDVVVKETAVVGSLDVDSLYPSLDIDRCVSVVKKRLIDSGLQFKNLQWKEIALYLRYNMTEDEIEESGFAEYLPRRRYHRRPPLFVRSGSVNNTKIRHQPWIHTQMGPDDGVMREMFCEAIRIMIKRTMHLHDYSFMETFTVKKVARLEWI